MKFEHRRIKIEISDELMADARDKFGFDPEQQVRKALNDMLNSYDSAINIATIEHRGISTTYSLPFQEDLLCISGRRVVDDFMEAVDLWLDYRIETHRFYHNESPFWRRIHIEEGKASLTYGKGMARPD